jgi:hypothetical protein
MSSDLYNLLSDTVVSKTLYNGTYDHVLKLTVHTILNKNETWYEVKHREIYGSKETSFQDLKAACEFFDSLDN